MAKIKKCGDCERPYRAEHGNSRYCASCVLGLKSERSADFFSDEWGDRKIFDPVNDLDKYVREFK